MKKVLVTDDDDLIRLFIRQILETRGLEVVEADDGDTAVGMIREHPDIELLILDLKMPRMSGKEAYRIIRTMRPDLACMVSSADIPDEEKEDLSAMGVKTFLIKPYSPEDLYRALEP